VLVAGMTISTAFTLFLVPAIYLLIARDRKAETRTSRPVEGRPGAEVAA
jgi:multidrug efflux pump